MVMARSSDDWNEIQDLPHPSQLYALTTWPHCNIYPFTKGHCKLCLHKMIKKSKKYTGCSKKVLHLINKRQKAFRSMSEIHFVLNKQGTLNLFGLGFCQPKKTGEGGQNAPPPLPNLAISNQMTMKVGKNILWVEIFTN